MLKTIRVIVASLSLIGLSYAGSAGAISIDFVPGSGVVVVGSTVTVDVKISGLGDHASPSLGAYDLGVLFDPNYVALSVGGVTYGDPVLGDQLDLSGFGSLTSTTPGVAQGSLVEVRIAEVSLDPESILNSEQAGEFILARLAFSGVGLGTSPITLALHDLSDAANNAIPASAVTLGTGSIQSVPEIDNASGNGALVLLAFVFALLGERRGYR